jgi:TolB-like protein
MMPYPTLCYAYGVRFRYIPEPDRHTEAPRRRGLSGLGVCMSTIGWVVSLALLSAPVDKSPEKPGLVVASLRADGADKTRANVIDELLVAEIDKYGSFRVIGMSDVQAMLGFDKAAQIMGCDEVQCAVELGMQLGGALGVRFLVAGSVTSLEGDLVLTIKILDLQKAIVLDRATADVPNNPRNFKQLVTEAVSQLSTITGKLPSGIVSVTTEPAAAMVVVDGKEMGLSPQNLPLSAGNHELAARLKGFGEARQAVVVSAGARSELKLSLVKLTGGIVHIETDPAGAGVSVDGKSVGPAPVRLELREGGHTVHAEAHGFADAERMVRVVAGDETTVSLVLPVESSSSTRTLGIAGMSAGAVSLGLGVFAMLKAKSAADDFKAGNVSASDTSKKFAGMMYVGVGAGVVLGVAGLVLFNRQSSAPLAVMPVVGPTSLGLEGRW